MIILILKLLFLTVCFFCCFGFIYSIALIICRAPSRKTHKAMTNIVANHEKRKSDKLSEINRALATLLSRAIFLNPYKKMLLESKLGASHFRDTTAEIYTAESIVVMLEFFLIALFIWFFVPIFSILCALIGILAYFSTKGRVDRSIRTVQHEIEIDLPRFVYAIKAELTTTSSVVDLLEKHKSDYTLYWEHEMNITLADMKSGNYEIALTRLEARVGSSNLSEVTRGLIEMSKGNDTKTYWEALEIRFSEYRKQELLRQVEKIPSKVQALSLWLILSMVGLYLIVLGTVLFDSLKAFGL